MDIAVLLVASILLGCTDATLTYSGNGETREFWNQQAKVDLMRARAQKPNINVAKNVILFLGDGVGVSTVTAARILKGQLQNHPGEEDSLSFEAFPNIGLSKTYNQNAQTPDSAGTSTAFLSGVKTNAGVLGLDGRSVRSDCATATTATKLKTIFHWSKEVGKSVGFVTSTRVTHATPGAGFAHTPERDWESDAHMRDVDANCNSIKDIAAQLIDDNDLNVVMGGGRRAFLSQNETDPETNKVDTSNGRLDGRNLVNVWKQKQVDNNRRHSYVWNKAEFENVAPANTDHLLGLFNPSHMEYETDRADDTAGEPSLAEMTEKAIKIMQKNEKGFFLLVEGGRIDHAHHDNIPVKALHDTLAFADAVQKAVDLTDESDTLIITTADHSHVFAIGGYSSRGTPIFGLTNDPYRHTPLRLATDDKPFTVLMYTNGPGSWVSENATARPNETDANTADKEYVYQAGVPLASETHAGEDVAIYARGPMSHLFHVTHEQNYIAHVMAYASCVGDYRSSSQCAQADVDELRAINSSPRLFTHSLIQITGVLMYVFMWF